MEIAMHVLVIIILCMRWTVLCSSLNATSFFFPNFDTNLTNAMLSKLAFYGAASVHADGTPEVNLINTTTPPDDKIAGVMLSQMPLNVWEYADGCKEQDAKLTGVDCIAGMATSFTITFQMRLESLTKDFYGGKGMLFFLLDNLKNPLGATGSHFGVFPAGGDDSQNLIWGVEFDTHEDEDVEDIDDNHVGIDNNNAVSEIVRSMSDLAFDLNGDRLTVWIEYNSLLSTLEVRLSQSFDRPADPFLQMKDMDIRNFVGQQVYPGFSAVGNDQVHQIFLWSLESTIVHPLADPPAQPANDSGGFIASILSTVFHVNIASFVKVSGLTLLVAVPALVAAIFLALRLTKCGQKLMLKMYAKVEKNKCCSACCGLGVCVLFCTIPRDDLAANNLGKPKKKEKLRISPKIDSAANNLGKPKKKEKLKISPRKGIR